MKRSSFLKSITLALTSLFIPKVTKEVTGQEMYDSYWEGFLQWEKDNEPKIEKDILYTMIEKSQQPGISYYESFDDYVRKSVKIEMLGCDYRVVKVTYNAIQLESFEIVGLG